MRSRILSRLRDRVWWVLALSLAVRGWTLWSGQASLHDDPDAYARLAVNWSQSGVYGVDAPDGSVQPTAYRPPLYPWLLSWFVASAAGERGSLPTFYVAGLHLLLGLATVWCTWSIARDLHLQYPALPALLVACDPILLRASQLVMTETIAACLTVLAWKLWLIIFAHRPIPAAQNVVAQHDVAEVAKAFDQPSCRAEILGEFRYKVLGLVALGGVLGLSILARPTAAPWVALVAIGLAVLGSRSWRQRLSDAVIVSLVVAACLVPWVMRNIREFGKPIWATTHGGYTLLLANNPLLYRHFYEHGPSRDWDAEPFHARWALRLDPGISISPAERDFWFAPLSPSGQGSLQIPELADDRIAYTAARQTIARQPLMFGLSSLYRIGWLWAAWPNDGRLAIRLAIGLWYGLIYACAIAGTWRWIRHFGPRRWLQAWWLPLMLVVSLTLLHAVFWSNMRMRAPASAVLAVAAGSMLLTSTFGRIQYNLLNSHCRESTN